MHPFDPQAGTTLKLCVFTREKMERAISQTRVQQEASSHPGGYNGLIGRSPVQFPDYLSATAGAAGEHVNPKVNHAPSASTTAGPVFSPSLSLSLSPTEYV